MAEEFHDDRESVRDEDVLLRRIDPDNHLVEDESGTGRRLSTGAFKNTKRTNSMSVNIGKFLAQPTDALRGSEGHFLVAFTAGFVRHDLNPSQGVTHTPADSDRSHGDVWGNKNSKTGVREPLRQEANRNWIVRPPNLAT